MTSIISIRGIYATALTGFFSGKDEVVVHPSRELRHRFPELSSTEDPHPDVQVRDLDSGQGVAVSGFSGPVARVINLLKEGFPSALFRGSLDGPGADEVEFSHTSKSALDELRHRILPTVHLHHRLRLIGSDQVDRAEKDDLGLHPDQRTRISRNLEQRLIWHSFRLGERIRIEHVKPDGRVVCLSGGHIISVQPALKKLVVKRCWPRGGGVYDGLGAQIHPGDHAVTEVVDGQWHVRHTYFRSHGELIGTYANVNTPVECYPGKIRYVDLEVDVVRGPRGGAAIIDQGDLAEAFRSGYVTPWLKDRAAGVARELRATLVHTGRHPF